MVFPEDLERDPEAERDFREEWIEIAEEEQIAEGDISVSETVDGHDPRPDVYEEADPDDMDGMHIADIEDEGGTDDPVDHYLEDENAPGENADDAYEIVDNVQDEADEYAADQEILDSLDDDAQR